MSRGLLFALAVVVLAVLADQPPAMRLSMNTAGFNQIKNKMLPVFLAKVQGMVLPEDKGRKDGFDYDIKNVKIQALNYQSCDVAFRTESGLPKATLSLVGISIDLTLDFSYRLHIWPHHPQGHGSSEMKASEASMVVDASLSIDPTTSHPVVHPDNVRILLPHWHLSTHGDCPGWLIDLIFNHISAVKTAVEKGLDTELRNIINTLVNAELGKIPLEQKVFKDMELDLRPPTNGIYFDPTFFDFATKGEFTTPTPQPCPAPHHNLPIMAPAEGMMMSMVMDEYMLNSMGWVLYYMDYIHYELTKLPDQVPFTLNTSDWQDIIPPLYDAYPNQPMKLGISIVEAPPSFKIQSDGLPFAVPLTITMWSKVPGSDAWVWAFDLLAQLTSELKLDVLHDGTLIGEMQPFTDNLQIEKSAIGTWDLTNFQGLLDDLILNGVAVPMINDKLGKGILLPHIMGLELTDGTFTYNDGWVNFQTNLDYIPPK